MSAYDAGYLPQAKELLRGYLQDYPAGIWQTPAAALLAEVLQAQGDPGAAQAWAALPAGRRCYGVLRARGLLAPASSTP